MEKLIAIAQFVSHLDFPLREFGRTLANAAMVLT